MRPRFKFFTFLLVSILCVLFSLGIISASQVEWNSSHVECTASCHSTNPATTAAKIIDQQIQKKKAPVAAWLHIPSNLFFLYVSPVVLFIWFMDRSKTLSLTARFRF